MFPKWWLKTSAADCKSSDVTRWVAARAPSVVLSCVRGSTPVTRKESAWLSPVREPAEWWLLLYRTRKSSVHDCDGDRWLMRRRACIRSDRHPTNCELVGMSDSLLRHMKNVGKRVALVLYSDDHHSAVSPWGESPTDFFPCSARKNITHLCVLNDCSGGWWMMRSVGPKPNKLWLWGT